jgi:hypothetical protein
MTSARRLVWRFPHWWVVALCAAAWGTMAARWWNGSHAHRFGLVEWTLMVGAMMLPLVFGHLRVVAARSLWPRRQRGMMAFLCGYSAISLLAGAAILALVPLADVVAERVGSPAPIVMGLGLAAAWQLSPLKRRALNACHRTMPLSPRGWPANRDCLRYGWAIGRTCCVSCAGLMLACVLAGHSLPVMVAATAVAGSERVSVRATAWTTSAALALMATVHLVAIV